MDSPPLSNSLQAHLFIQFVYVFLLVLNLYLSHDSISLNCFYACIVSSGIMMIGTEIN